MNRRLSALCTLACAVLALAGCDSGGREAPPKVNVRIANAAPGFAVLNFRREQDSNPERSPNLGFKNTADFIYDADTYDFFVTARSLDLNVPVRSWTFAPTLEPDLGYTFVLTEAAGEVVPVVLSYPAAPAADAQIVGLHAAIGLPALDLYLERPGVGIAGATPRGTFGAQAQIAPLTLASGEYEVTLTAAGDPANVLLTTTTITLPAGATSVLVVVPEGGQGPQPLSLLLAQPAATSVLYHRNANAELRVINAAEDRAPRDVAINNEFAPPLFSAVAFAAPSEYAPTPVGSQPIAVTPAGNPGVLELNQTYNGIVDQRTTLLFAGPAGTLAFGFGADDGRRIHKEARLRFMNGATQFTGVDFVLTIPDASPDGVDALRTLAAPGIAQASALAPGDYDLYLRQTGTSTLLYGPTRITVAEEGLYEVLAVNGPDATTASVAFLGDFL